MFKRVRKVFTITCVECSDTFQHETFCHANATRCRPCMTLYQNVKQKAANAMAKAIRAGHLKPAKGQDCVDCGKAAYCLDHRDYLKPLDVVPVCNSCNVKRGPGKWRIAA